MTVSTPKLGRMIACKGAGSDPGFSAESQWVSPDNHVGILGAPSRARSIPVEIIPIGEGYLSHASFKQLGGVQ